MVQPPEPGNDWGGFRIDREIGRGGRGRTYAAFDAGARRTRALKILMGVPSDDPVGERFQRYPLRASELGHPNIIVAHHSSDVDGTAFVVMDLVVGGSIADEIGVSVSRIGRAREVLAQVASAVDAAGGVGLVHANLKPTNILCGANGGVVISDFGCTRFADEALRSEPVTGDGVAGLPFHEAPESLTGDAVDTRADIYSMTTVLYEMLTGRPPYAGITPSELTAAHRSQPIPGITALRPDLPADFDAFIARGMAKDRAQRPGSGAEFMAELDLVIKATLEHRRAEARREREPAAEPEAASKTESQPVSADPFEPLVWDDPPVDPAVADVADVAAPSGTYRGSRQARRDATQWRLEDGTIDGAAVGVYEEDPPRRWVGVVVAVVLVVAIVVVGWLVYRAVQADSDTGIDAGAAAQQVTSPDGSFSSTM